MATLKEMRDSSEKISQDIQKIIDGLDPFGEDKTEIYMIAACLKNINALIKDIIG